jgi:hypothetical protein
MNDPFEQATHGSRSFLIKVAGGLVALIALVSFVGARARETPTVSTSTQPSTTSGIGVADLAPSTSVAVAVAAVLAPDATLPDSAMPEAGLPTPQAAARNLWDAWKDRDRTRALLYADPDAVTKLFESSWQPQIRESGCTPLEQSWLCRFEGPRQRWDVTLNGTPETGYRALGVRVGDPAGELVTPDLLPQVPRSIPVITGVDGVPAVAGPTLPPALTVPPSTSSTSDTPATDPVAGAASGDDGAAVDQNSDQAVTTRPTTSPPSSKKRAVTSKSKRTAAPETSAAQTTRATKTTRPKPTEVPEAPAPDPEPAPSDASNGPVPVQGGTTPVPSDQ